MVRNDSPEWSDHEPVGVFHITDIRIKMYPEATHHIIFMCPNHKQCAILLGPKAISRTQEDMLNIWQWNGDVNKPTITPSINCIKEKDGKPTGGCGWHGFITNGIIK
jgi:hypothetical protein